VYATPRLLFPQKMAVFIDTLLAGGCTVDDSLTLRAMRGSSADEA